MNSSLHIIISPDEQSLALNDGDGEILKFPISTSAKGIGFEEGSFRTPTGNFRISEKIGHDAPIHTQFIARKAASIYDPNAPCSEDLILTRILRLEGVDPENQNSHSRFIYIHGTNCEEKIGSPASMGCIRLRNQDIITLFDLTPEGTPVRILPLSISNMKLLFLDCDSTLSSIEGIDELARLSDPETFQRVEDLTNAAMNGEIPLAEVFSKRMEIIRPTRQMADQVAQLYLQTILPGAAQFVATAIDKGYTPIIISGGFAPLIEPLAKHLKIPHVEAVPLHFTSDGSFEFYGSDFPSTRNLGKNEIIRTWKKATAATRSIMIGDGISDLETAPDVDLMIGFGGVIAREKVRQDAPVWADDFYQLLAYL